MRINQDSQGYLTILVLFTLTGIAMTITTGLTRTMTEQLAARTEVANYQAFHLAEAGVDEKLRQLADADAANDDDNIAETLLGAGRYEVTVTFLAPRTWQLESLGAVQGTRQTLRVIVELPRRPFQEAIFSKGWITLRTNSLVDSYNSEQGPYTPFPATTNRKENGTIRTNSTGNNTLALHDWVAVHGDIITGFADPPVLPSDVINQAASATVSGTKTAANANRVLEPVEIPPELSEVPRLHDLSAFQSGVLSAGTYRVKDCIVNPGETIVTNGPVTLYCTATVTIFDQAVFKGMVAGVEKPSASRLNVTGTEDVSLRTATIFVGTIYAPNTGREIDLRESAQVFGAIVGEAALVRGNSNPTSGAKLHYDESLAAITDASGPTKVTIRSWRQVP